MASCPSREGKRCNCEPRYRGHVKDASGRKIRSHWTSSKAEALAWRQEAVIALRQGRLRPAAPTTVNEAGDALILGMRTGAVLDRSGKPYKPKTVRTLRTRAEDVRLPVARASEGQLAEARRHTGLHRGDASERRVAVDRPQPPRPAARDRAPRDRQRRADGGSVRSPEPSGRPEQPDADRSACHGRGVDPSPT
jgi:hypothetical protein